MREDIPGAFGVSGENENRRRVVLLFSENEFYLPIYISSSSALG